MPERIPLRRAAEIAPSLLDRAGTPHAIVESGPEDPNGNAVHKLVFAGAVLQTYTGGAAARIYLEERAAKINGPIDAHVSELLAANSAEVDRRRCAEAGRDRLRLILDRLAATDDRLTVVYGVDAA